MSEYEDTIKLAEHVLNRHNADPDDDLAMLSRQFLRLREYKAMGEELAAARVVIAAARNVAPGIMNNNTDPLLDDFRRSLGSV